MTDIFKKSFQLYDQLLDAPHLDQVLEVMELELANPVIVVDKSFKVLTYSMDIELTDEIWVNNIRQGFCSFEFITEVHKIQSFRNAPSSVDAFKVKCHLNQINKWVSKIMIGGKHAGYLVIPECHGEITAEQASLISVFSKIIAHHISQRHYKHDTEDVTEEKLLVDLLEKRIDTPSELKERLKWLGLSFDSYKWIVVIRSHSKKQVSNKTARLHTQIAQLFPNSKQLFYQDSLFLLCSFREEKELSEEKIQRLSNILSGKKLHGIYSELFSDLLEAPIHFEQMQKAQNLAFQLKKTEILLSYHQMNFYQLLADFPDKEKLLAFCHPGIIRLLQYDKDNHTAYYQTLSTYLLNNQNLNQTAGVLYIHRNTMKYRLNKINEIIGLDLNDGMEIFQLAYSYMILHYFDHLKPSHGRNEVGDRKAQFGW